MGSYEQKYLKYKNKYLKIQAHKMMGGQLKIKKTILL